MNIHDSDQPLRTLATQAVPQWTMEAAAAGYMSKKTGMIAPQTGADAGLWAYVKAACTPPAEDTLVATAPTVRADDDTARTAGMVHVTKDRAVDAEILPDGSIHLATDEDFR